MTRRTVIGMLLAGSVATLVAGPLIGGVAVPWDSILHPRPGDPAAVIFWQIRLPRVCLAWLAGAGLALAGVVFQALFRNALAEPYTLGVSSGASCGAAVAVRLNLELAGQSFSGPALGALVGAIVSIGIVYGVARLRRDASVGTMLLAGVAVSYLFSSLILLVQYTADYHDTFRILRWLMGGLQNVGFEAPLRLLPVVGVSALLLGAMVGELDLLATGEDLAASRGVAVGRVKGWLFGVVSVLVGVIVSLCGPVGFVGLMCPHIGRLLVGPAHRRLLPAAILFGGAFLVCCDTVARTAFAPTELPVGIFTSFLGGPFFLWLLLQRRWRAV